jgi:hypothetical protein
MTDLPDPSAPPVGDAAPIDPPGIHPSGRDAPTPQPVPSLFNDLGAIETVVPGCDPAGAASVDAAPALDHPDLRRRRQTRRMSAAAAVLAVLVLVIGLVASFVTSSASATHEPPTTTTGPASGNRAQAADHRSSHLAAATSAPLPAPPTLAASAPIQST